MNASPTGSSETVYFEHSWSWKNVADSDLDFNAAFVAVCH
jgi:hypothetical protein